MIYQLCEDFISTSIGCQLLRYNIFDDLWWFLLQNRLVVEVEYELRAHCKLIFSRCKYTNSASISGRYCVRMNLI